MGVGTLIGDPVLLARVYAPGLHLCATCRLYTPVTTSARYDSQERLQLFHRSAKELSFRRCYKYYSCKCCSVSPVLRISYKGIFRLQEAKNSLNYTCFWKGLHKIRLLFD